MDDRRPSFRSVWLQGKNLTDRVTHHSKNLSGRGNHSESAKGISHAWHFDAHLVANYLGDLAVSWGVEHIEGEVVETRLNEDGEIKLVEATARLHRQQ